MLIGNPIMRCVLFSGAAQYCRRAKIDKPSGLRGERKMIKLYFENAVTTVTTLALLALLWFIGDSIANRAAIVHWGRRCAILLAFGLVVCCLAAARDGLDETIRNAADGSCAPGIFPLVSAPNIAGCAGALLIAAAAIAAPIAKTQRAREGWFYVMSCGAAAKIATVEIARILLR